MAAKITSSQPLISVNEGEPLFLPCLVEGFPSPSMSWFKSRDKLSPWTFSSKQDAIRVKGDGSGGGSSKWSVMSSTGLFISKATVDHAGHYSCHVNNSIGRDVKETEVRVYGEST